jgi:hypothetical protein
MPALPSSESQMQTLFFAFKVVKMGVHIGVQCAESRVITISRCRCTFSRDIRGICFRKLLSKGLMLSWAFLQIVCFAPIVKGSAMFQPWMPIRCQLWYRICYRFVPRRDKAEYSIT